MAEANERWLVAAWPGIGHVATTAAVYLLSKLRMHQIAEFAARDLFELERVEVRDGILKAAKLPRSRLFLWLNPAKGPDIVVFLGEAQPPAGKLALCDRLLDSARRLGVRRVFTFAATVAGPDLSAPPRAFGVATDALSLDELRRNSVPVLSAAEIGGLNGVLLAAAAEAGLPGIGLLGETPGLAAQLPYAGASAAVLRTFAGLARIELDLNELEAYGKAVQEQVALLEQQVRDALRETRDPSAGGAEFEPERVKPPDSPAGMVDEDTRRIETLFTEARRDRSKAFELKRELDRLGRFRDFEDRFLDLFEGRA